jgi:N-formylglutamate deformylase
VSWLHVERSDTPLILAFPHGGTDIPAAFGDGLRSPASTTRDADWHIRDLYTGLADATLVWTDVSRSIIDCNRDPSGASLYPGQATTGLCPLTDFDGETLYRAMRDPDAQECDARRDAHFWPYHAALQGEIDRLRALHPRVVVYDCHSIRSRVPRLFDGDLPELNIGTDLGKTCDPALERAVTLAAAASGRSIVVNGRFRGGWTTRHYGRPESGVHAVQMEIAMRAYLREPDGLAASPDWPPAYDPDFAAPLRRDLARILAAVLDFAKERP